MTSQGPKKLAPRVGVSERGFVGSGLLGVDANGEGPPHGTPAYCAHVMDSDLTTFGIAAGCVPEDSRGTLKTPGAAPSQGYSLVFGNNNY